MEYPILNLTKMGLEQQSLEQIGTKAKSWFIAKDGKQFLFKIGRPGTGENWAEKVACELCSLLGLPHAIYDLATHEATEGVLSPSFITKPTELLLHGNELLHKYRDDNIVSVYKQRHHTVGRIFARTRYAATPDTSLPSEVIKDGADVFIGYLLLDAWIGNQDRHDQNWGIIAARLRSIDSNDQEGKNEWAFRLAPTCDHASSMGRELKDDEKKRRLSSKDQHYTVDAYAAKSRSAIFLTPAMESKPLLTIDSFYQFSIRRPKTAMFWLDRLLDINPRNVHDVFARMPRSHISEPSVEFGLKILEFNKVRLEAMKRQFNE